jgi:hypothetical protein
VVRLREQLQWFSENVGLEEKSKVKSQRAKVKSQKELQQGPKTEDSGPNLELGT